MMILGKPEQRMSRVARQKLRDDSQAVNIGDDSGRHDKDFFSPADPHGSSQKPSCQKMRNWTHYLGKPPVCPVSLAALTTAFSVRIVAGTHIQGWPRAYPEVFRSRHHR